jgi:hypothetical protein
MQTNLGLVGSRARANINRPPSMLVFTLCLGAICLFEMANYQPGEEYKTLDVALAASVRVYPTKDEFADADLIVSTAAKSFFDKAIDAETTQFRNVAFRRRALADGKSYIIMCGETNGANRFGGMTGFKAFMVGKFQGRRYDPVVAGELTELSSNIHNFCYNADPVIQGEWLSQLRSAFSAQMRRVAKDQ